MQRTKVELVKSFIVQLKFFTTIIQAVLLICQGFKMAARKEIYTDIQELLEDSENTPLIISRKLNIPVEWVFQVMEQELVE
jgi:hypothetical protein